MKCKKCGREIRPEDVVVTFGLNPTEATHWKCYPVPAPMRYDERRMTDLLDELRKYEGLPPHNQSYNFVCGDNLFYRSIKERFTQDEIKEAYRRIC